MTTDLDPTTGLPALPENMFWNVSREGYSLYELEDEDTALITKYAVNLMCRYPAKYDEKTTRTFWGRKKTTRRLTRHPGEYVVTSMRVREIPGDEDSSYVKELSPETIRETAIYLLKKTEQEKADREKEMRYLGDYPPKSLDTGKSL